MNYHGIVKDDMNNGQGMRVTVFLSGCNHRCKGCQNPETWDNNSGVPFTDENMETILEFASDPYITGLTLSGGDPLNIKNLTGFDSTTKTKSEWSSLRICKAFKERYPKKNIWVYTGYTFEELEDLSYVFADMNNAENGYPYDHLEELMSLIDVLVDGRFDEKLADSNYHWAGSTNQRVINIPESWGTGVVTEIDEY